MRPASSLRVVVFGRLRVLFRRRASPFGDGRFRDEMKGKIPIFPIDINRFIDSKAVFRMTIISKAGAKVDSRSIKREEMHQLVDAFKYAIRARKPRKSSTRQKGGFTNFHALLALPEGAIYYI